jgi:hypothetical protein
VFEVFTDGARRVVVRAQEWTRAWRRADIGTGELLAALAGPDGQEAAAALSARGVTPQDLETELVARLPPGRRSGSGHIPFSNRLTRALERAVDHALQSGSGDELPAAPAAGTRPRQVLRPGHLLLGLLDDDECTASRVLAGLGVDPIELRLDVRRLLGRGPGADPVEGMAPVTGARPASRHRPAGTSRFPQPGPDHGPPSGGWAGGTMPAAERMPSAPDLPASGPARAAWIELQRRQARLPVAWMRTRSGYFAVRRNESRSVHRLAARLGLRPEEERLLHERHDGVIDEISRRADPNHDQRLVPGPGRQPRGRSEGLGHRPPAGAVTRWIELRRPGLAGPRRSGSCGDGSSGWATGASTRSRCGCA